MTDLPMELETAAARVDETEIAAAAWWGDYEADGMVPRWVSASVVLMEDSAVEKFADPKDIEMET